MDGLPNEIEFEVLQEDIDKSTPGAAKDCPIYHALKRIFPTKWILVVGNISIDRVSFDHSKDSLGLMSKFDDKILGGREAVKPCKLRIKKSFP